MSYSIGIYVKVEGCDKYAEIAYPEYSSPSYNLGRLFRSCMDWDFKSEEYYRCDYASEHLNKGIKELVYNPNEYIKMFPELSMGSVASSIDILGSIAGCILEQAENIPLECMYMKWE
nr:MAG TPA: hypothetical protein [Caudoviricetes sp.]